MVIQTRGEGIREISVTADVNACLSGRGRADRSVRVLLNDSRYKQNQVVSLFCDRLSTHLPKYSHWNSKGVKCVFTYKTCFVLGNLVSLCLQLQELWTLYAFLNQPPLKGCVRYPFCS